MMNRRDFLRTTSASVAGCLACTGPHAVMAVAAAGSASAGEWANLRGRVVYDGTPPVPPKIQVNKDQEVCGKYDLVDERLLVNRTNHGVKNVIVMLWLGAAR